MGDDANGKPAADRDGWILSTLPRAIAFAAGLLRDRSAAEDVVHECYCRLLSKAKVYDLPRDGTRLLFRAITNACIDISRRRGLVGSYHQWDDGLQSVEFPDGATPEPWRNLERRELEAAIERGLGELPLPQRAAVELKSMGHSIADIAGTLDVTPNNVYVLLHRARQSLARSIENFVRE